MNRVAGLKRYVQGQCAKLYTPSSFHEQGDATPPVCVAAVKCWNLLARHCNFFFKKKMSNKLFPQEVLKMVGSKLHNGVHRLHEPRVRNWRYIVIAHLLAHPWHLVCWLFAFLTVLFVNLCCHIDIFMRSHEEVKI
jgi:hypothetical protein